MQNEETRNTFQMREQDKTPGKLLNEMDISNLPDEEFKVIVTKNAH